MALFTPSNIYALWSYRKELKLVAFSFLIILALPFVAVALLMHSGIDIISDRLATVNEQTQAVDIHDPTSGAVTETVQFTFVWPTKGVITNEFGEPHLPYYLFHSGIDIAGKKGDPVNAFMPGKVIYEGEIFWGFGKHIIIDHGNNVTSIYGHLSKIKVHTGQEIKTTTHIIGEQGSTGWSTGTHLHFQINVYGLPVNPRTFLGNGTPI